MTRPLWLALLALGALAPEAEGRRLWSRGDASLEWTGSVREILVWTHGTDAESFASRAGGEPTCAPAGGFPTCPAFGVVGDKEVWQSLTRLRLRFDLQATPHLSAVLTYDNELFAGTLDTFSRDLGESLTLDRLLDLEWQVKVFGLDDHEDHFRWEHLLYRAYVKLETERFEALVGRQRIAWGVGRLWNPIDRFNAIPPLAIEGDQSLGADALLARWLFSGFTFLEAVWAPNGSSDDAAYALRLHGVLRDVDYSLVGGVFDEALTLGFDLAGNLGDAAFRIEAVYTDPRRDVWPVNASKPREVDPYWQVVASVDRNFDLGSGLYVLVEHLYNGNALGFGEGRAGPLLAFFEATDNPRFAPPGATGVRPADLDRFGGSVVVTFARQQTGFQLGYDLTPILRGDLLVIYDWNGESAAFAPTLTYSPVGSLELTLGVQAFAGPRKSQYGSSETLVFLLTQFFF